MRILLTTLQYLGHVVPAAVFKHALEQRGHFVHWEICAVEPITGPLIKHLAQYEKAEPAQYVQLTKVLKEQDFDCLLSDPPIFAAWNLHRDFGIPWAIFGNLPIFYTDVRVPLYLQCSLPDFEPAVRAPNVKFIGPMVPSEIIPKGQQPYWYDSERKIVHVTQGTVAVSDDSLVETTRKGLAWNWQELVLVTKYFDYCHWMGKLSCFVTNGGFSGVSQAIFHGVPMVIAGTTEDKTQVAERAEAMGVAINLRTDNPSIIMVKEAIHEVLNNSKYAIAAKMMKKKCQFFNVWQGVDHLEELVFGQPAEKILQSA